MRVLGLETSCDETALAIYDDKEGIILQKIHSQTALHQTYGGVVPELASRDHIRKIIPFLREMLQETGSNASDIDAIAYTAGPGLIGALLVGAVFARSLAWAWQKPCVPVHHLEAHLLAVMLEEHHPSFPFLGLLVSGGHTLLVRVNGIGNYEWLGETLDDAAGEAFDKTAKLLGLGYPGGPAIAELAKKGDPKRFHFPRPMTDRPGLDFSFSGLKTSALNAWRSSSQDEQTRADIAVAFEIAVVETFVIKCRRALEATGLKSLVMGGGVAANQILRTRLQKVSEEFKAEIFYPRSEYCTDNGAMVAYTGYEKFRLNQYDKDVIVRARWPLVEVSS